jgi:hypothetical protein
MRTLIATLSMLSLVCCSGCFTAAKRSLAEVEGASATLYPIHVLPPGTATGAGQPKVRTAMADGSGAPEFRAALQQALVEKMSQLSKAGKIKFGGGAPLNVKPTVRFYASKGASKLLGGMSFAVIRVEAIDSGGKVVGKADVLATTKALRTGTRDLANAAAEKIIVWAATGQP